MTVKETTGCDYVVGSKADSDLLAKEYDFSR